MYFFNNKSLLFREKFNIHKNPVTKRNQIYRQEVDIYFFKSEKEFNQ